MPRRKYGRMVKACPPTPQEKCRLCRLGYPCPVHSEQKPDFAELARERRRRYSGKRKGKKRAKLKLKI